MVAVKLLDPDCRPARRTPGSSGYDLLAREARTIAPGAVQAVPVGVVFDLPSDVEVQVRPKSGLATRGVLALWGTVDSDYRGEVLVVLFNHSPEPFVIEKGRAVAQAVFSSVWHPMIGEVDVVTQTERGAGGFGSTGI